MAVKKTYFFHIHKILIYILIYLISALLAFINVASYCRNSERLCPQTVFYLLFFFFFDIFDEAQHLHHSHFSLPVWLVDEADVTNMTVNENVWNYFTTDADTKIQKSNYRV